MQTLPKNIEMIKNTHLFAACLRDISFLMSLLYTDPGFIPTYDDFEK